MINSDNMIVTVLWIPEAVLQKKDSKQLLKSYEQNVFNESYFHERIVRIQLY